MGKQRRERHVMMRPLPSLIGVMFLAILGLSVAHAQELQIPNDLNCQDRDAFETIENLVIVDRTTDADPSAKERYKAGVGQIFQNEKYAGHVTVGEIRDTSVAWKVLGSGCLDSVETVKALRPPARTWYESLWRWLEELFRKWLAPQPSEREVARRRSQARDIGADRAAMARDVAALIETSNVTKRDTEIAQSLTSALQSSCERRAQCNIFVYSDLLDSAAKLAQKNKEDMRMAGRTRARSLLEEYQPEISKTVVITRVWGFARGDEKAGVALDDERRRGIREYWLGFFDVVEDRAAPGSSSRISDMYVE